MNINVFYAEAVKAPLTKLSAVTAVASDIKAHVLLTTIAGQETGWAARVQAGGYARSYWQFEKGGGVAQVMQRCLPQVSALCRSLDVPVSASTIFEAMAWNDTLACGMARLLLWQDPKPLPSVGDTVGAWNYYVRNWAPGIPRYETWQERYQTALQVIGTR